MLKNILLKELKLLGSAKSKILSILVLLLSLLFIYHFALEKKMKLDLDSIIGLKWSILFFLSYILIGQMTEDEKESEAFQINQLFLPNGLELFSKSIIIFLGLSLVNIFQNLIISIIYENGSVFFENIFMIEFISIPSILALSFLGVIISELSYETDKKEFLLPILLIPLSIPVLLFSIGAEQKFFNQFEINFYSMIILFSFSILYLSLGLILKEYILI